MPSENMIETTLIEQNGNRIAKGEMDFIDLESVELELVLNQQVLREDGFEECLRKAGRAGGFDFLFKLPLFDQIPGQQIAVMSTRDGEKLLYAVLDKSGTDVEIVPEDAMRSEIRDFAAAFRELFSQLGTETTG